MDAAGHLGPAHRGRAGPGQADRRPGHPGRGADRVDQRAHRVRRRHDHRGDRRTTRRTIELGLDTDGRRARPPRSCSDVANSGVGGPGVLHRGRGRQRRRSSRSGDAGFMVNWPFVWPRALARGRGRHARPVGRSTTTAGRCTRRSTRARPSAPPYGGINLGVGAFSEHADLAYEAAECIVDRGEPGVLLRRPTATRRPSASVYDDPEVHRGVPDGAGHPGVAGAGGARGRRRRTTARSPAACSATYHPPTAVDPETTGRAGRPT